MQFEVSFPHSQIQLLRELLQMQNRLTILFDNFGNYFDLVVLHYCNLDAIQERAIQQLP